MPQPQGMARAILNALPRAAPRQCTRLMSTARAAQPKRPTAANTTNLPPQPYPPVVRRGFKTVEEAKSRYKSGVRIAEAELVGRNKPIRSG